jgi:hypothetical protein
MLTNSRMTPTEYDLEREKLRQTYGDNATEAGVRREQALALLFYRSGWTHQELANKEGKSQPWVACKLRFGRFLNFITTGNNSEMPANLTERRFRGYWEQTGEEPDERQRFQQVLTLIRGEPICRPRRPKIGKQIRDQYADGKLHDPVKIAEELEVAEDHVRDTIDGMAEHQYYGCKAEKKANGKVRITRNERMVSASEIATKLKPIIDSLLTASKRAAGTISNAAINVDAHRLAKLVEEWTG